MTPGNFHSSVWWILWVIKWSSVTITLLTTILPMIPAGWIPPSGMGVRSFLNNHVQQLAAICTAIYSGSDILLTNIGHPRKWQCVKSILHDFQRNTFNELDTGEFAEHHRVTLYRYCKWHYKIHDLDGKFCSPLDGWLVPVVRAGTNGNATTTFRAKSASEFEGVCGAAFFAQSSIHEFPFNNKGKLADISENSTDTEITQYAKDTFMSVKGVRDRIKRKRPCARSFLSFKVEVDNKLWGVIMIDSRAESLPTPKVALHKFEQINDVLKHMLKGF